MTSPSSPEPDQVARVTSEAAELLGVLWGRASTAPVSASQLRVLFVLEHHGGINLRTLAETLGSSPSSTSRLCDRLQAVGFVERRSAAGSRREVELYLSHRGRSFLTVLRGRRESALESVLAQLPAARRAALLHGLEAFCLAAADQLDEGDAASGARTA
ncbi:MarR family winged helix-turn-helix transcriptional regulator [Streptomyces longwoodensis]|uniref:MarR family winged helix-turn-helix transcriptional regulator n=1 Tax=Streptomyces longwoodensis TaxID=68231 RepID=UPI0033EBFEBF